MSTEPPDGLPPFLQLLLDLARPENSSLLQRFRDEPRGVMDEYGVSPGNQELLLSGDLERIREAIDAAYFRSGQTPPSGDETYPIVVTWAPPKLRTARMIGVWG